MKLDLSIIRGLSVCQGLTFEQAAAFLDECTVRQLRRDDILTADGRLGIPLSFVRSGAVELAIASGSIRLVLRRMARGDLFGAPGALCLPPERDTIVVCRHDATILSLDFTGYQRLVRVDHPGAANVESAALSMLADEVRSRSTVLGRYRGGDVVPAAPRGPGELMRGWWQSMASSPPATPARGSASDHLRRRLGLVSTPIDDLVAELGAAAEPTTIQRGVALDQEGQGRGHAYVVRTGSIGRFRKSSCGGHVLLSVLEAGSLGGFETVITGGASATSSIAMTDATVLRIRRTELSKALGSRTQAARTARRAMLAMLARWQDLAAHQLLEVYCDRSPVEERATDHAFPA